MGGGKRKGVIITTTSIQRRRARSTALAPVLRARQNPSETTGGPKKPRLPASNHANESYQSLSSPIAQDEQTTNEAHLQPTPQQPTYLMPIVYSSHHAARQQQGGGSANSARKFAILGLALQLDPPGELFRGRRRNHNLCKAKRS